MLVDDELVAMVRWGPPPRREEGVWANHGRANFAMLLVMKAIVGHEKDFR
jgi:hypothetical protein